jgi:iron complex transport system substrate-binding protein
MSRVRILVVLILLFFSAVAVFPQAGVFPLTLTDDLGTSITVRQKPRRIVSITLTTDEILLALVDKTSLLGVTAFSEDTSVSNVASQVFDIPNKVTLNVELIVSLQPDLVFVADWSKAESVTQLRDAGMTVYRFKSPSTIKEIENRISRIGQVVGAEAKAKALIDWMEKRLSEVARRISSMAADKRLTVMDYNTWGTSMGKGSSWDEIVRLSGLQNVVAGLTPDQWGQVPVSKEKLLQLDPDILLLPGWVYGEPDGSNTFYRAIVNDPALKTMRAVKEGRVYRLPESIKTSTSQYIVFAVEELARLAYPDLFK